MLEQKQALKCISYNYWEEVDHKVGVVKQKNLFAKGILIDIYYTLTTYYLPIYFVPFYIEDVANQDE